MGSHVTRFQVIRGRPRVMFRGMRRLAKGSHNNFNDAKLSWRWRRRRGRSCAVRSHVVGFCSGRDGVLTLRTVRKRFTADRSRVGCCISIADVGAHITRTGRTTRMLCSEVPGAGCISAVMYVSKARIINAFLARRVRESKVVNAAGRRRAICIVSPRVGDGGRVLFESGGGTTVGKGRIILLLTAAAANRAVHETLRYVRCCKKRVR